MFFKKKNEFSEEKKITENESKTIEKINNNFKEKIKVDDDYKDINVEKRKFMENLKENPELLEEFSSDRLEKILKYYQDENEKKRNILKKLTA